MDFLIFQFFNLSLIIFDYTHSGKKKKKICAL